MQKPAPPAPSPSRYPPLSGTLSSLFRVLRRSALATARVAGVTTAVAGSRWRRERLLILCYHGVSLADEHQWDPQLFMSAETLRERFTLLRDEGYRVLPLSEAIVRLHDGTLPPRSVCLTFDDGFADFALRAVPLLEEFELPATVYVTTHYMRHRRPIFNLVVPYLLWRARGRSAPATGALAALQTLDATSDAARARTANAVLRLATTQGASTLEKDELARAVAEAFGLDYDALLASRALQIMSPAEVRALPRSLVDVQLHTHRHRSPMEQASFEREVRDNRADLAELVPGAVFSHFCYPSGVYSPGQLPWLRALGVNTATTCEPALAERDEEPLLLPRFIDTMRVTPSEFVGWLSGVSQFLPRRTRRRAA